MRSSRIERQSAARAAAVVCDVCGSPDWFRCAPGTAPDATGYPHTSVVELRAGEDIPMQTWCRECDLCLKQ